MEEIKVYKNGERVLIEVEVVSREFRGDKVLYGLKDPRTGRTFDYTYEQDELFQIKNAEVENGKN